MIIESFLKILFDAVTGLINLLPNAFYTVIAAFEIPQGVKIAAYFFPLDCLVVAITSFLSWYAILLTWGVVEWLYKKIPGVD